jgi:hypothetical protein
VTKTALEHIAFAALVFAVIRSVVCIQITEKVRHPPGSIFQNKMLVSIHNDVSKKAHAILDHFISQQFQKSGLQFFTSQNGFAVDPPVHAMMKCSLVSKSWLSHFLSIANKFTFSQSVPELFEKNFRMDIRASPIIHFHNYPRHPQSNGHIERFNRTVEEQHIQWHEDELLSEDLVEFNHNLMEYLIWFNTEKPHRSLNKKPPLRYYIDSLKTSIKKSNMLWTLIAYCKFKSFSIKSFHGNSITKCFAGPRHSDVIDFPISYSNQSL